MYFADKWKFIDNLMASFVLYFLGKNVCWNLWKFFLALLKKPKILSHVTDIVKVFFILKYT